MQMGPVDPSLGDCSSEPHYAHASQEVSLGCFSFVHAVFGLVVVVVADGGESNCMALKPTADSHQLAFCMSQPLNLCVGSAS